MSIGLVCHYLVPKKNSYINNMNEKTLRYSSYLENKYSQEHIENIWLNNISNLHDNLKQIIKDGYKVFRISSSLFPLADELKEKLESNIKINNKLKEIGDLVKSSNLRLTCHPDQFCVLSSDSSQVIENSIKILEHHAWIFDKMELEFSPFYAINIHGGKKGNIKTLISSVNKLNKNVKSRLTLENDEKSYSIVELYEAYQETGVSLVFDSHHHMFNTGSLSLDDGLLLAKKTWTVKQLTHLSNTTPGMENSTFNNKRKHSDYVHYIPDIQKEMNNSGNIDIDFEFKMKNVAIQKALHDFNIML